MANTYYSSKEELLKIEEPLLGIDSLLEEYGKQNNLGFIKNDHEIERTTVWKKDDGVYRKFGISIIDEKLLSFIIFAVAWQDRDDGRYIQRKLIIDDLRPPFKAEEIIALLDQARKEVTSWTRDDLKKAYPDEGKKKKK